MRQLTRAVIRITTDSILKRPATTGSPVLERQLHFDPTGRAQMKRFVTNFESGNDHRLAEVDLVPIGTSNGTNSSHSLCNVIGMRSCPLEALVRYALTVIRVRLHDIPAC
jgi:hypothetical protein